MDYIPRNPRCCSGKLFRLIALLLGAFLCSHGSVAQAPMSVSISPGVASVGVGRALRLTATVRNDRSGKGVVWSYTNPACTSSQNTDYIVVTTSPVCGTLKDSSPSAVIFNAPIAVPSPAAITITATSVADNRKSSSARVMVTDGSPNVWLSPTGATVQTGHSRRFEAIVSGDSGARVSWGVNGVPGGNASVGRIDAEGLYTAPSAVPSGGTVKITAVLNGDRAVSSSAIVAVSRASTIPLPLHGVTIADYEFGGTQTDIRDPGFLSEVKNSLDHFAVTPTARITFTVESVSSGGVGSGGVEGATAASYLPALRALKQAPRPPYLLGEVLDSSYLGCFSLADHNARWKQYVSTLGEYTDVWEVGNEINGNWMDSADADQYCNWTTPTTTDATVVRKMIDAYRIVRAHGGLTELTLYYPGQESQCGNGSPDPFEPIAWTTANVPAEMLNGVDYVLISYYNTDCPWGIDPTTATWGNFYTAVQNLFPNAQIGFGEWGYSGSTAPTAAAETALIDQGYSLEPVGLPYSDKWASGVFYWEFNNDAVPMTAPFWSLFNTDMRHQP